MLRQLKLNLHVRLCFKVDSHGRTPEKLTRIKQTLSKTREQACPSLMFTRWRHNYMAVLFPAQKYQTIIRFECNGCEEILIYHMMLEPLYALITALGHRKSIFICAANPFLPYYHRR
jgi:hypothetical protein